MMEWIFKWLLRAAGGALFLGAALLTLYLLYSVVTGGYAT